VEAPQETESLTLRRGTTILLGLAVAGPAVVPVALTLMALKLSQSGRISAADAGVPQAAWGLGLTATMLVAGYATDKLGARRTFTLGLIAGIVGSVLTATLAYPAVVVGMLVIGASQGLLAMSSMGAIARFAAGRTVRAYAGYGVVTALASGAVGVVAGVVVSSGWLHVAPLLSLPLLAVGAVGGVRLPRRAALIQAQAKGSDLGGAFLGVGAAVLLVLATNAFIGAGSPLTATAMLVTGVGVIALLVWWERRQPAPVLDLSLLRQRTMVLLIMIGSLSAFGLAGTYMIVTQYSEFVLGASGTGTGVFIAATFLAGALASWASAPLMSAWGPRTLLAAATGGAALTCVASVLLVDSAPRIFPLVAITVVTFGLGLLVAPTRSMIADFLPASAVGRGFGLFSTIRRFVQVIGVIVMVQVFTGTLPDQLQDSLRTAGISMQGEQGTATTGKALQMRVDMATRLTPEQQLRFVEAQRLGFIEAQQLAIGIDAAVLVGAALLSLALPRRPKAPTPDAPDT